MNSCYKNSILENCRLTLVTDHGEESISLCGAYYRSNNSINTLYIQNNNNDVEIRSKDWSSLNHSKEEIIEQIKLCNNMSNIGTVNQPPISPLDWDDPSFILAAGTYDKAGLLAAAVAAGYAGGKTMIHRVQFIAAPGGFTLDGQIVRVAGSAGTHTIEGNKSADGAQLLPIDDFSIVVTGDGIEANLIVY